MIKRISLLGATGSIGIQTLDIIKEHPDKFQLVAFSAGKNIEVTKQIIRNFSVPLVSVMTECKIVSATMVINGKTRIASVEQDKGFYNISVKSCGEISNIKMIGEGGVRIMRRHDP